MAHGRARGGDMWCGCHTLNVCLFVYDEPGHIGRVQEAGALTVLLMAY